MGSLCPAPFAACKRDRACRGLLARAAGAKGRARGAEAEELMEELMANPLICGLQARFAASPSSKLRDSQARRALKRLYK